MNRVIAILILVLLLLALGFFVGQSCTEKEIIVKTDFKQEIEQINKKIDGIVAMQDSIIKQRITHLTYITNENYTIDSLISIDSMWVNAIIRARNERLIELPGFFQIGTDTGGIIFDNKDSTGW